MTRKDYVMLARAINEVVNEYDDSPDADCAIEAVVSNLCHYLAMDNPRFDRARFKQAALKKED